MKIARTDTVAWLFILLALPAVGADNVTSAFCASPPQTLTQPPEQVPEQLRCLAMNVYFEARASSDLGQAAVAYVVLNRAANPKYPSTLCGVVHQGGDNKRGCQFSWWCDKLDHTVGDHNAWSRALRNSCRAVNEPDADRTMGALIYHAETMLPDWTSSWKRTAVIGGHVFYVPLNP